MTLPAEDILANTQNLTESGLSRESADAIATAIGRGRAGLLTKQDAEKFVTKEYLDQALEKALDKHAGHILTKAELGLSIGQNKQFRQLVTWMLISMGLMGATMGAVFSAVVTAITGTPT